MILESLENTGILIRSIPCLFLLSGAELQQEMAADSTCCVANLLVKWSGVRGKGKNDNQHFLVISV